MMWLEVRWRAKCGVYNRNGEGRSCETAVAGYVRAMSALCSRYVRLVPHYNGGSELAQWRAMCGVLLGNAIADC